MKPTVELAALALHHAIIAKNLGVSFETLFKQYMLKDEQFTEQFRPEELKLLKQLGTREYKRVTPSEIREYSRELLPITNHYRAQIN